MSEINALNNILPTGRIEYARALAKDLEGRGEIVSADLVRDLADRVVRDQVGSTDLCLLLERCHAAMLDACHATEQLNDPANLPSEILEELWHCIAKFEEILS